MWVNYLKFTWGVSLVVSQFLEVVVPEEKRESVKLSVVYYTGNIF